MWGGVIGRHGLSDRDRAGDELLEFCAMNESSIMNTWLQKKDTHQGTWTHPATKQTHTIDFVVMRAGQRVYCRDVQAMRGANCWTDDMSVRAKLNVMVAHHASKRRRRVYLLLSVNFDRVLQEVSSVNRWNICC
jgi:hypothetical protein